MKKNLAKAITLGLMTATVFSFGGMNVAGAEAFQFNDTVTFKLTKDAETGALKGTAESYGSTASIITNWNGVDSNSNYTLDFYGSEEYVVNRNGCIYGMNVYANNATLKDVDIKMAGAVGKEMRGLNISPTEFGGANKITLGSYKHISNMISKPSSDIFDVLPEKQYMGDYTSMRVLGSDVKVEGDVYIYSNIKASEGMQIANNGIWANESKVNLLGDVYVNTIIPENSKEAYGGDYGPGRSKNDALTARRNSDININIDEAGNSRGHKVNILGNLDVKGHEDTSSTDKGGKINMVLDGEGSYWHGEEVRHDLITRADGSKENVSFVDRNIVLNEGDTLKVADNAILNVTLMNGAQWIPDREVTQISQITLKKDGIINMAGDNLHIGEAKYSTGFTKEITIGKLTSDGGVFRMDINAPSDSYDKANTKNGGDFVYIKSGSGNANLKPVVVGNPENFSYKQPVWFSNAANGITFGDVIGDVRLSLEAELVDGKARIANPRILIDTDAASGGKVDAVNDVKDDGTTNWYLVGIEQQPEPEPDPDPIKPEPEPTPTPTPDPKPENPDGKTPIKSYNSGFAMWRDDDTLLKRLGELRFTNDEGGVWVRTIGRKLEDNREYGFNNHAKTVQVGYDRKDVQKNGKGTWRKGIAVGHTWSESSFGSDGHGHNNYTDLTLYGTNVRKNDHYLDFVARVGKINSDYDTRLGDHADYDNWATSISAEYGRKKKLNDAGWYVEPQAQLTYSYMWGDNFTSKKGMIVNQGNADSLVGRAGFILSKELESERKYAHRYYAKAFVMHEFLDGGNVAMTDSFGKHGYVGSNFKDTWYVVGVGANVDMGNQCHFYFDAERNFKASVKMPYRVEAGFRWEF